MTKQERREASAFLINVSAWFAYSVAQHSGLQPVPIGARRLNWGRRMCGDLSAVETKSGGNIEGTWTHTNSVPQLMFE